MPSLLRLAYMVVFPALVFSAWWHHWWIINPEEWEWLFAYDRGQNFLGWHLFRLDEWRFPLGQAENAYVPHGFNIVYTDSLPLLSLFFKLFSSWLPSHFQLTGFWYLFVCYANFLAAFVLVRGFKVDEVSALVMASLLMFYPPFFQAYMAPALCGHFLFLAGLAVFFHVQPLAKARLYFALLLVVACLIHAYFVPMIFFLLVAHSFYRGGIDRASLGEAMGTIVRCVPPLVAVMAVVGFFGGYEKQSWGVEILNIHLLDMIDARVGQKEDGSFFSGSRFLPALSYDIANVSYQYWGLGWLAAVALSFFVKGSYFSRRARWLLRGMIVILTLIALSPAVFIFDVYLFSYDSPLLVSLLNVFRFVGRFFWLASALIVLMSLLHLYRHFYGGEGRHVALMLALLLVQLADVRPLAHIEKEAVPYGSLTSLLRAQSAPPSFIYVNGSAESRESMSIALRAADASVAVNRLYLARQRKVAGEMVPLSAEWLAKRHDFMEVMYPLYRLPSLQQSLDKGAWAVAAAFDCFDLLSRDYDAAKVDFYFWNQLCLLTPKGAIAAEVRAQFHLTPSDVRQERALHTILDHCEGDCRFAAFTCFEHGEATIEDFRQRLAARGVAVQSSSSVIVATLSGENAFAPRVRWDNQELFHFIEDGFALTAAPRIDLSMLQESLCAWHARFAEFFQLNHGVHFFMWSERSELHYDVLASYE